MRELTESWADGELVDMRYDTEAGLAGIVLKSIGAMGPDEEVDHEINK